MAKSDIFRRLAENPEIASTLSDLLGGLGGGGGSGGGQTSSPAGGSDQPQSRLDQLQFIADVAGVADPSGIVDAANAAVYLGRAVRSGDQSERREHLKNALISGISIIPYVGDLAKISKFRGGARGARTAAAAGEGAENTLLQELLQGGLAGGAVGSLAGLVSRGGGSRTDDRRYTIGDTLTGGVGRMMREDIGRVAGRQWEAAKTNLNPFALPTTKIASSISAVTKNVSELPGMLESWGNALSESQRHLRSFNGVISVAVMESERRDIMRNIGSGARTAASTQGLMQALSDLKDELQPFRDAFTNFANTIGTGALKALTTIVQLGTLAINIWARLDTRVGLAKAAFDALAKHNETKLQTMSTPGKETMQYFRDWKPPNPRPGAGP